jgi:hypothetical protein
LLLAARVAGRTEEETRALVRALIAARLKFAIDVELALRALAATKMPPTARRAKEKT